MVCLIYQANVVQKNDKKLTNKTFIFSENILTDISNTKT